ncbi:MAG: peptidylprolyl isomerase [Cellulomonadaceae bacterium]|nr:peptidylprolyl isomerase [Cellulomonadaceae bacterium]
MSSTKQQQRARAAKQQAKWEARQAARKHKQRIYRIVAGVCVLALVGAGVAIAALTGNNDGSLDAADDPTATESPYFDDTAPDDSTGQNEGDVPDPAIAEGRTWTATMTTSAGDIVMELDGAAAPQAVANFIALARDGFFTNTSCHRLVTSGIFVLQCGDPEGTGMGGPGWNFGPIENAPADDVYPAGTLAMARVGGNAYSMGSQFFLVYEDSTIPSDQAGGYTVFGRITSGLDVVQSIANDGVEGGASDGSPATQVVIEGVEVQ